MLWRLSAVKHSNVVGHLCKKIKSCRFVSPPTTGASASLPPQRKNPLTPAPYFLRHKQACFFSELRLGCFLGSTEPLWLALYRGLTPAPHQWQWQNKKNAKSSPWSLRIIKKKNGAFKTTQPPLTSCLMNMDEWRNMTRRNKKKNYEVWDVHKESYAVFNLPEKPQPLVTPIPKGAEMAVGWGVSGASRLPASWAHCLKGRYGRHKCGSAIS